MITFARDLFIPTNPGSPNEGLSVLSNNFREAPHVPEPGTILGLLAVGGLGLVSRFKKQK
ncbi:MAG: PEP-CTERM sorting domain-containing protein [Burkholderiales bacterium]|nr:PEP-CTERM sorting domain-containing protein [Burkholderiales bacterium]